MSDVLEQVLNSKKSASAFLGKVNVCHLPGWEVNPETGRCWKSENSNYIRRPRRTPNSNSR